MLDVENQSSNRRNRTMGLVFGYVAVFVVAVFIGAAFFSTNNSDLAPTMEVGRHLEKLEQRLDQLHNMMATETSTAKRGVAADTTVDKYAAKYLLPRYYQRDRGTCWDFATIGMLEQSYRQNGVEKGYLKPQEYVRFSEQAYGISMIAACKVHPEICDVPGDFVIDNSTEGGEIDWIYSLTSLYNQVLPVSVCPYTPDGDDLVCPGMTQALKTNPIKFNIISVETAYSAEDSRALLFKHQKPLGWSSLMHVVQYYFPCTDTYWKSQAGCNATNRVRCPENEYYNSEYCAVSQGAMYNMDAEFYMYNNLITEGGHAMNAVGFNDNYMTKSGFKGGFIIKNSWEDKVYGTSPAGRGARGSHSVQYYMQEISDWEEKTICPNPLNPENWLSCVQQSAGPTMSSTPLKATGETFDISGTCLDPSFMYHLVNVTYQPTEFKCIDPKMCSTDSRYRWFLSESVRNVDNQLTSYCMLRYDTVSKAQLEVCTPFNNPSSVAYIWNPIDAQASLLQDSEDLCGYYFWPYAVLDRQVSLFGDFHTTYFEIEWDDQSYYYNAKNHPDLDYTLVKSSSGTQQSVSWATALPMCNVRY